MDIKAYFEYINSHGADLFTVVLLPNGNDRFPTVIVRTPYVDWLEDKTEEFIVELCKGENIPCKVPGFVCGSFFFFKASYVIYFSNIYLFI